MHNLTHKLKHYLDGSRQLEDTYTSDHYHCLSTLQYFSHVSI